MSYPLNQDRKFSASQALHQMNPLILNTTFHEKNKIVTLAARETYQFLIYTDMTLELPISCPVETPCLAHRLTGQTVGRTKTPERHGPLLQMCIAALYCSTAARHVMSCTACLGKILLE